MLNFEADALHIDISSVMCHSAMYNLMDQRIISAVYVKVLIKTRNSPRTEHEPLVRKWEITQGKEKMFDLGGN